MEPEGRKNDAMLNGARNADDIGRQHILLCDDGDGGRGDTSEGMGIGTIYFSGCASGTPAGNDATPSLDQISVSRNSALFPTFRNLRLKQTKLLGRARRVLREKNDDSTGSDESLEVSSQGAGPEHEELFQDERGQKSERDELLLGRSSILDSEISLISGSLKGTRTGSETGPIHVGNLSKVKGDEPDGLDSSNPNAFAEIKEGFQALHDTRKQQNGIEALKSSYCRLGVTRTAEIRNLGNEGHSTNLECCKHVSLEVSVNESGILSHVHTDLEGSSNESKLNPENLNNDSIRSCMVSTNHAIHNDSMNLDSKRFLHSSSLSVDGTRHHVATSGTSVKPASKHVSFAIREISLQQSCTQDSDVEKKPDINGKPESPLLAGSSLTKNEGKMSSKNGDPQPRKPRESNNFVWVNCKRYQKLGKIGSGGSSEVFKVIAQDCTIYALKRINLKGRDRQTACGFHQEIEYLQLLQNKSHIIQLVDYEVTDKTVFDKDGVNNGEILADVYIYMVLEYGEIDLAHMLERKKRELSMGNEQLDENWLRLYWEHILKAVNTIHEERIVHADLKPANFLLVQGVLKLIDFGIAKAIQNDTTNIVREAQVGTVNYMSPEAFMMNGHDEHLSVKCGRPSDIWSLGCILYQMVYGRTPFSHLNFIQRIREITNPLYEISFPEVSNPLLLDIIKKCLVWDKNKRPRIPELLEHPFLRPQLSNVLNCSSNQCLENFLLASWKLYLSTVGITRFKLIVGKVVSTPAASLDIEPQLETVLIEMSKRYISEAGLSKFQLLLGSFTDVARES